VYIYYGSASLHLIAKRPRLSLALAVTILVGGGYTGHRVTHAAGHVAPTLRAKNLHAVKK
jgi:hypothetical protein